MDQIDVFENYMLFQWEKIKPKSTLFHMPCTKNRGKISPNFWAVNFQHSFPGTLRNCIVVVEICSGMGATKSNFMASTDFRRLTTNHNWTVDVLSWIEPPKAPNRTFITFTIRLSTDNSFHCNWLSTNPLGAELHFYLYLLWAHNRDQWEQGVKPPDQRVNQWEWSGRGQRVGPQWDVWAHGGEHGPTAWASGPTVGK